MPDRDVKTIRDLIYYCHECVETLDKGDIDGDGTVKITATVGFL